jgi:integrase
MGKKIKNPYYKAFLEGDLITEIRRDDFIKVIDNIEHEHKDQARAMLILMWSTGARPNEILRLKGNSFVNNYKTLTVKIPGSKGSLARMPRLLMKDPLTTEIWQYIKQLPGEMFVFWFFRSEAKRYGVTKTYNRKNPETGEIEKKTKTYDKIYYELSRKLRYYIPKWFEIIFPEGIPPYYLRHNRLSIAGERLSTKDLMLLKGSKTEGSVRPYLHLTRKSQKMITEELMK